MPLPGSRAIARLIPRTIDGVAPRSGTIIQIPGFDASISKLPLP